VITRKDRHLPDWLIRLSTGAGPLANRVQSSSIGSSVQYAGSVSTSGRYPAILRSWQSSQVYVRKMPRASYWADFGLPDPHEHVFERHCSVCCDAQRSSRMVGCDPELRGTP
jgi:hypothetical protein